MNPNMCLKVIRPMWIRQCILYKKEKSKRLLISNYNGRKKREILKT